MHFIDRRSRNRRSALRWVSLMTDPQSRLFDCCIGADRKHAAGVSVCNTGGCVRGYFRQAQVSDRRRSDRRPACSGGHIRSECQAAFAVVCAPRMAVGERRAAGQSRTEFARKNRQMEQELESARALLGVTTHLLGQSRSSPPDRANGRPLLLRAGRPLSRRGANHLAAIAGRQEGTSFQGLPVGLLCLRPRDDW